MIFGVVILSVAAVAFFAGTLHGQMSEATAWRMAAEGSRLRLSGGHEYEIKRRPLIGAFW